MKTVTTLVNARKHDSAVRQHHATGVVLLSSAGELLFMNHEAQIYIRQLQPHADDRGRLTGEFARCSYTSRMRARACTQARSSCCT